MSFWVWVIRAEDLEWSNREGRRLLYAEFSSEDERRAALDTWQEKSNKLNLYSEPFGGDGTVYRLWTGIASKLRLPMLMSLYEHGIVLETANQLEQLQQELDALEAYWDGHSYELRGEPTSGIYGQEREHLQESMGYLREAIRVARENGATLGIT